ncbi:uncharacterized protein LOC128724322 [Anopheles nili]|uniref:uncharacterized protein LOC128724322 n=1 Tax=Anopheles nili TaxID=185578 RepID=UPI00237C1367|nr:uncharacterized protein LOC128724322 [Anopheles nili]
MLRCIKKLSFLTTSYACAACGIIPMVVILLTSCVGLSTYWMYWTEEIFLKMHIATPKPPHNVESGAPVSSFISKVFVSYALPVLVTLSIYYHRWQMRPMIRTFNYDFTALYCSHRNRQKRYTNGLPASGTLGQYIRLATKQIFEVIALGVLCINLKTYEDIEHSDGENFQVGKLISTIGFMLPAIVCLLVSFEMGINFSFIAIALNALNSSLEAFASSSTAHVCQTVQYMRGKVRSRNETVPRTADSKGVYLRQLVMQYDNLGRVVADMVQVYSPILLTVIGMHFVRFTVQLFLCYRHMSRTSSELANINQLGQTLVLLLSSITSAVQIIFLVDTAADFSQQFENNTVDLISNINRIFLDEKLYIREKKDIYKSLTTLSLIINRVRSDSDLYGYFYLDRSLVMTIIASSCSYLIVLIQVM